NGAAQAVVVLDADGPLPVREPARRAHRRALDGAAGARHRARPGARRRGRARVDDRPRLAGDRRHAQALHRFEARARYMRENGMAEHRRAPRVAAGEAIQVTNAITGEIAGRVGNLSVDGMMLVANRPAREDALYQFAFDLVDDRGRRHTLE